MRKSSSEIGRLSSRLSIAVTYRQLFLDKEIAGDEMLAAITTSNYSPKNGRANWHMIKLELN